MRLHCLGTAGYHPGPERQTSCYFLPESGVLLDAGTGLFRLPPLIRQRELHILISHAHLDHTVGLTFLVGMLGQGLIDRVSVWGQAEKLRAIREHLFHPLLFPAELQARWRAIDDLPRWAVGDCQVSWRPQSHPGGSVAYRLDWRAGRRGDGGGTEGVARVAKSLVYATDTAGDHDEQTLRWMSSADLLMHECNFVDSQRRWAQRTGHTWAGRVASVAAATAPRRLLLTHVNPTDESAVVDPGVVSRLAGFVGDATLPVTVARDGAVVDF